jgi:hypothetical protein
MQRKWPFITVASLLNALLITGVFISLYPRGFTIADFPYAGTSPVKFYTIAPFLFATAMFVFTFLIIIAGIAVKQLVSAVISRLKMLSHGLAQASGRLTS